jgi:hypothetical protein
MKHNLLPAARKDQGRSGLPSEQSHEGLDDREVTLILFSARQSRRPQPLGLFAFGPGTIMTDFCALDSVCPTDFATIARMNRKEQFLQAVQI